MLDIIVGADDVMDGVRMHFRQLVGTQLFPIIAMCVKERSMRVRYRLLKISIYFEVRTLGRWLRQMSASTRNRNAELAP